LDIGVFEVEVGEIVELFLLLGGEDRQDSWHSVMGHQVEDFGDVVSGDQGELNWLHDC
jgi:hypothetical protein